VDEAAAIGGGSVVAVAHSTYLRMLLATMLDIPLAQAATLEQKNGCINVLDLRRDGATRVVGPKSTVLGGRLSSAPRNFGLEIPKGTVVRVNEKRHLEGIPLA
jgi:broad specificity phosphatase PhoE